MSRRFLPSFHRRQYAKLAVIHADDDHGRVMRQHQPTHICNQSIVNAFVVIIEMRERKIAAGEWLSNRPYSAAEAEEYRDGVFDDDPHAN